MIKNAIRIITFPAMMIMDLSRYIRIFDFRDHSITMVEIWSYNSVYQ